MIETLGSVIVLYCMDAHHSTQGTCYSKQYQSLNSNVMMYAQHPHDNFMRVYYIHFLTCKTREFSDGNEVPILFSYDNCQ